MENSTNNKFLNGFILGAIIGGGLVLLLNTKKGKKLLKTISEGGLESLATLIENNQEALGEEDEELSEDTDKIDTDDSVSKNNDHASAQPSVSNGGVNGNGQKPLVRRFFKGIARKF